MIKRAVILVLMLFYMTGMSDAYELYSVIWNNADFPITYYVNPAQSPVNQNDALRIINTSFGVWESVLTSNVNFTYFGATQKVPIAYDFDIGDFEDSTLDGYNVMGWYNLSAINPGALGLCLAWFNNTQIVEADIAFDILSQWSVDDTPSGSEYDLQFVALHEIGHFLGFDHENGDINDLMYPSGAPGEILRSLPQNYADAITALYPGNKTTGIGSLPMALYQNAPNPFRPVDTGDFTVIPFTISKDDHVRLDIFNLNGELVKTLVDRDLSAGSYTGTSGFKWFGDNGTPDSVGDKVGSGVYIYQLRTGSGHTNTGKLMIIR